MDDSFLVGDIQRKQQNAGVIRAGECPLFIAGINLPVITIGKRRALPADRRKLCQMVTEFIPFRMLEERTQVIIAVLGALAFNAPFTAVINAWNAGHGINQIIG